MRYCVVLSCRRGSNCHKVRKEKLKSLSAVCAVRLPQSYSMFLYSSICTYVHPSTWSNPLTASPHSLSQGNTGAMNCQGTHHSQVNLNHT